VQRVLCGGGKLRIAQPPQSLGVALRFSPGAVAGVRAAELLADG
jgi:hypothetical protein